LEFKSVLTIGFCLLCGGKSARMFHISCLISWPGENLLIPNLGPLNPRKNSGSYRTGRWWLGSNNGMIISSKKPRKLEDKPTLCHLLRHEYEESHSEVSREPPEWVTERPHIISVQHV